MPLESALARPQTGYYNDLIQEAAALWESLSQNHPFFHGNQRVAVKATGCGFRNSRTGCSGTPLRPEISCTHRGLVVIEERCPVVVAQ
ncbi:MAG: Fic family protein [Bryobacteraceae bacterium]